MELKTSTIHRNLAARFKIMGMDAFDLIFLLLFAEIMNLIFGGTRLQLYLVFILPLVIGLILFFSKRNKPDKYLIHLIRYYILQGHFSAGSISGNEEKMKRRIYY